MISGAAKLAGVMGWPISQSKSPLLHGTWIARHKIDAAYIPMAVAPADLESVVQGLKALGFAGWNITAPHKETIMPMLDSLSDAAQAIGAVNTVIRQSDGSYLGHNTDAFGFMQNLKEGLTVQNQDTDFTGKIIALLGAGGASRAVVFGLLDAGTTKVIIANRTLEKAKALASDFGPACQAVTNADLAAYLPLCQGLINATALGMTGKSDLPLEFGSLPTSAFVTDLVYAPLETKLLAWAKGRGHPAIDGLGMLLHQAREGFEAWFDQKVQVDQDLRDRILAA